MFPKVCFFPLVTTSRNQFIKDIAIICESGYIKDDRKEEWIQKIKSELCEAHYFVGIMFIEKISFYLILHELIHHISASLRGYTQSRKWYNLDYLIDGLDIFLFRK